MALGFDIKAGCELAIRDMYGDWYRDPWGWPEIWWLAQRPDHFDITTVLKKPRSPGAEYTLAVPPSFHLHEVPKSRLALRPAVVQDSLTRLVYLSAVATNLSKLHSELPDWVYGWRQRPDGRMRNDDEWKLHLARVNEMCSSDSGTALLVDIASFFASIDVERLNERVYEMLGKSAPVSIVADILRTHDGLTTRSGIPQRSFASSVLAHVYVRPLDDAMMTAMKSGATGVARWMDDISAVGSEERMYQLFLDLRDRVQEIGLNFNDLKSKLVPADEALLLLRSEELREINVPVTNLGSDYTGAEVVQFDTRILLDLEERILGAPAAYPVTLIKAVLTSLKKCAETGRWKEWLQVAHQLPHIAAHLGRYLRSAADRDISFELNPTFSTSWDLLASWFVTYARQPWARVGWATSQLALMFPASVTQESIVEVWSEWLATSEQVQMVAIAGQRLAAKDPSRCRDIIRGRVDRVMDPVLLRVLGLALLTAGEGKKTVRSILDRDPRNMLVSKYLEATNWKAPKVPEDFDSKSDND